MGTGKEAAMKKLLEILGNLLPTGMLVLGAVAVSCGIAMIHVPAGVISAGALAIIGGVLLIKGGGDIHE